MSRRFVSFFFRLDARDLWSSHEARAAQDAQLLLNEGNLGVPRLFDEQLELQKPPLYYWLVAAGGWLRGGQVDAWAVRLPAALAGLGTVLVVYGFLASRGRPRAALLAATLLATAQHFTWMSRVGRIDMPLTFCTATAVFALWPAAGPSAGRQAVGYLAMAAAVLLKGPLGIVLPGIVLLADAVARRQWPAKKDLASVLWGVPLVAVLTVPWYVAAHRQTHGEFTLSFFWTHHIQRALGGAAMGSHPWYFYAERLAIDWLPWSPLFLFATLALKKSDAEARLGAVWLLAVLLLLSASRFKRADYLLPAYPGAALWLGCTAERWLAGRPRWLTLAPTVALTAAALGWAIYLCAFEPALDAERQKRTLAADIRRAVPAPSPVLFFRVEDHCLAWHLGRPQNTFREWENLDWWVARPEPHYVVMPADCADTWPQYITSGVLDEVLRYTDLTERRTPRPLALMRTHPRQ